MRNLTDGTVGFEGKGRILLGKMIKNKADISIVKRLLKREIRKHIGIRIMVWIYGKPPR